MSWWQQFCDDVSGAFHSFEDFCSHVISTIGFTFVGIEDFIQFLGEHGLNPIEVIPDLSNRASSKGADPIQVLEEVAGGILHEGPIGYTSRIVRTQIISPIEQLLERQTQQANGIGSLHQTTLNMVGNKLLALQEGDGQSVPMSGLLADQVNQNFATIDETTSQLLTSGDDPVQQFWERQNSINAQTASAYEFIDQHLNQILLIDALIICVEVVAVVACGVVTIEVAGVGAVPAAAFFGELDAVVFGAEFFGPLISWAMASLANVVVLAITEIQHLISSSSPAASTSHAASITLVGGGASNGGQTVVVNGDGTGADAGGWSIDDQKDLAWTAAIACAAARAKYIKRTGNGNINYAEGFLSLNGQTPPESYGPILGTGLQDTHSEQVIINYWTGTRLPQLRPVMKPGSNLNLIIFTRNQMCIACTGMIPTWVQQLAAAAGPGVTIHFYLWQSIDPTDPVGPGNIEPVPII